MSANPFPENPSVVLIGSGIMSANLGVLLKLIDPSLTIQLYETGEELSPESSNGWNNAGTGHAGICELSYTPHTRPDGSVDPVNPIRIFEEFEYSKQFWAYAASVGMIAKPEECINAVPHISFVHGQAQVDFLRARHAAMSAHHFFREMEFSTDRDTIANWAPLLLDGRGEGPIAATKMDGGTDINFGGIARNLLGWLASQPGCHVATNHRVTGLRKTGQGWQLKIKDLKSGLSHENTARFVFVGAGGGTLPLLQKARLPEANGLGGFPIGGQWLVCQNPGIVAQHQAKVYGQTLDAAPTMAVPHLDTRILDGKKSLLFGPFAAWTTKFLNRYGSYADLPLSIRPGNLLTLMKVGVSNLDLVKYLIHQGTQSMEDRMQVLRIFYPAAKASDWKLVDAGIRVQAIKKTDGEAGIVHYGTEVLTSQDRSLAALLGASPGASVSVHIVLNVLKSCFPELVSSEQGRSRLSEIIPIWNTDIKLAENERFFQETSRRADRALQLIP